MSPSLQRTFSIEYNLRTFCSVFNINSIFYMLKDFIFSLSIYLSTRKDTS